jgi:hypothetical protein
MKDGFKLVLLGLFLNLFCLLNPVLSDEIRAGANAWPQKATIGEIISYEINATYNNQLQIVRPENKTALGEFMIREAKLGHKKLDEDNNMTKISYELAVYKTGAQIIPTQNIRYKKAGQILTAQVPAITIQIQSVLTPEIKKIRDLKPALALNLNPSFYLGLCSLLFLIVGLIGGGWLYFLKKGKATHAKNALLTQETRTPAQIAYAELEKLKKAQYLEKGEIKKFYSRLGEIIKKFWGKTWQKNVLDMTTAEVLGTLQDTLDTQTYRRAQKFLYACDLVKFAKFRPTVEESIELLEKAYRLVDERRKSK